MIVKDAEVLGENGSMRPIIAPTSARAQRADIKKKSHEEAFAALARAVQKAIQSGKAGEMLQSMNKDSAGDFQNLSHGYREWAQLQKALKTNDASIDD